MQKVNEYKIVIQSPPVAQPRPRVTRWGTFDPAKDQKNWARIQISSQFSEKLRCPIEVDVIFYMPISKSTSKKNKKRMLENEIKHQKNKDIDNLCKFVFDSMNDIVFEDDKQIWHVDAKKIYSENPRTEITLKWDNPL